MERKLPADVGPRDYEAWADYLFRRPDWWTRVGVAEVLIKRERRHRYGLGLFLSAVQPLARKHARKWAFRLYPGKNIDVPNEFLYDAAMTYLIRLFREEKKDRLNCGLPFRVLLYRTMNCGILYGSLKKVMKADPTVGLQTCERSVRPRCEEAIYAREMMEKLAAWVNRSSLHPRLREVIEVIVSGDPAEMCVPAARCRLTYARRKSARRDYFLDLGAIGRRLGLTRASVATYLSEVRRDLRAVGFLAGTA